jgi:hypothetical protein
MVQTRLVELLLPVSAAEEAPPESLLISLSGSLKTGNNKHEVCACLRFLSKRKVPQNIAANKLKMCISRIQISTLLCIASWLGSQECAKTLSVV